MYLLSEVREVTSCPTPKSARYAVRRSERSANFVGFNWVLAREGTGWDLNEFGARVSLLAAGELVECLSNLILMHMLGSICY